MRHRLGLPDLQRPAPRRKEELEARRDQGRSWEATHMHDILNSRSMIAVTLSMSATERHSSCAQPSPCEPTPLAPQMCGLSGACVRILCRLGAVSCDGQIGIAYRSKSACDGGAARRACERARQPSPRGRGARGSVRRGRAWGRAGWFRGPSCRACASVMSLPSSCTLPEASASMPASMIRLFCPDRRPDA